MMFLASGQLDISNAYVLIIAASVVVLLSFVYNQLSAKTNIPSVLMLILTGIGIQLGLKQMHVELPDLLKSLELLGIVGLIMIVLEAALDLKLTQEKLPLVGKTLLVAVLGLILTSAAIVLIFVGTWPEMSVLQACLYAVPLGIMSSAIIIPSVANLVEHKKEFMIYESAFSDIIGIMLFYFFLNLADFGFSKAATGFGVSLIITIVVALVASYALIFVFKDLGGNVRLFLLIATLLLLYSLGKLLHLSPLIIILVFGMSLANHETFFGFFKNPLAHDRKSIDKIAKEFHLITAETAFVVRTFFFVAFGMSIDLMSLFDLEVLLISLLVTAAIYIFRFVVLFLFNKPNISPELNIAPRGLITILLFYAITKSFGFELFEPGVILYVIIISSLVMTYGLIKYSPKSRGEGVPVSADSHH